MARRISQQVFPRHRAQANALVATSVNAVSNRARTETFKENDDVIKGQQQVSTLDNKTSDICISYSGMAWDLEGEPLPDTNTTLPFNGGPPRHFNCRSSLVPVLKSFEELGLPPQNFPEGTRASIDGQVPADITFNEFLRGKSKTFQDRLLGKRRAGLWRSNRINLRDLVDQTGRPLTVDELLALSRKRRAAKAAATTAAATPPPPAEAEPWEGVPVFKRPKDVDPYFRENLVNRQGRYAEANTTDGKTVDVSVNLVSGWDRVGLRVTAMVTRMMSRRFGMTLPNFIGGRTKHPEFKFRGSNKALASVHMESDSLLLAKGGLDTKRNVKEQPLIRQSQERKLETNRRVWEKLQAQAEMTDDEALKIAVRRKIEEDDFVWTVGDEGRDTGGLEGVWRTMVHESGHRLHAQFRQEIDDLLADAFPDTRTRSLWYNQTSKYATTNQKEFVAEQFVTYMLGRHDRVHPRLLEFFRSKDKDQVFGIPKELIDDTP